MPVDTVLAYSLACIAVMLSMLFGLIVYIFHNLKGEVLKLAHEVAELTKNRAKLVHKDECRGTSSRIHSRLDEVDAVHHDLHQRIVKVELRLEHLEPK